MGGKLFSSPPFNLNTPRMPLHIYTECRDHILTLMRTATLENTGKILRAECAIEAPGKTDYGDIDVLLLVEGDGLEGDEVARLVGAKVWTKTGKAMMHFAVPWPKGGEGQERSEMRDRLSAREKEEAVAADYVPKPRDSDVSGTTARDEDVTDSNTFVEGYQDQRFIQLDVTVCPASKPDSFVWTRFHTSHGDLWNMLGSMLRPRGLTVTDTGFYIRIPELEARNKSASRVLLTADPARTLVFLGLDEERYWRPFGSLDEMFAFAGSCRFFHPGRYRDREREQKQKQNVDLTKKPETRKEDDDDDDDDDNNNSNEKPEKENDNLKANDRARLRKRPAFRLWREQHLPQHSADGPTDPEAADMSRPDILAAAKTFFGPVFTQLYESRRLDAIVQM